MAQDLARVRKTRGRSAVSACADANPDEDFAESVAAFRYAPPRLKQRSPARFAFLRDRVFAGRSYGSAAACAPAAPLVVDASAGTARMLTGGR